jgi:hypothetical protein
MGGEFIGPIIQGLSVVREHEQKQKQAQAQAQLQAQQEQDFKAMLIAKLMERGGI